MENLFEQAIAVTGKRLKPSSHAVYASMWRGFQERLYAAGTAPGKESAAALAIALEGAGDYSTQKHLYGLVTWVYEALHEHGYTVRDNTEQLHKHYLPDHRALHPAVSERDIAAMADLAVKRVRGWKGVRLAAMVSVLGHTGLKQNELISLKKTQVTVNSESATLKAGKKEAERVFTLEGLCAQRLRDWLLVYPASPETPWLFVANSDGRPMDSTTVWRQLKRLGAEVLGEALQSSFGTGLIRASLAKSLEQQGATSAAVCAFLGHQRESSTAELLERVFLPNEPLCFTKPEQQ